MIIYPAIDLRGGRVVRLKQGDPERQTVFSDDPVGTARRWLDEGASWIHVVNLDGALTPGSPHIDILEQIAGTGIRIQYGGGLREIPDVERALRRGATRVVLGTLAVREPETVALLVQGWGAERVCVALDARDGKIATHGWQQSVDLTPAELGSRIAKLGVRHALFTDIGRDGELSGVNVEATAALAEATGLHVIASGGVSTAEEIRSLAQRGVAGAVIGMALYEGRLSLADALTAGDIDAG